MTKMNKSLVIAGVVLFWLGIPVCIWSLMFSMEMSISFIAFILGCSLCGIGLVLFALGSPQVQTYFWIKKDQEVYEQTKDLIKPIPMIETLTYASYTETLYSKGEEK